jgi:hypothetical protein
MEKLRESEYERIYKKLKNRSENKETSTEKKI